MSVLQTRHNLNAAVEQLQFRGERPSQNLYDMLKARADGELAFAEELVEKARAEVVDAQKLIAEVEAVNPNNPANKSN